MTMWSTPGSLPLTYSFGKPAVSSDTQRITAHVCQSICAFALLQTMKHTFYSRPSLERTLESSICTAGFNTFTLFFLLAHIYMLRHTHSSTLYSISEQVLEDKGHRWEGREREGTGAEVRARAHTHAHENVAAICCCSHAFCNVNCYEHTMLPCSKSPPPPPDTLPFCLHLTLAPFPHSQ